MIGQATAGWALLINIAIWLLINLAAPLVNDMVPSAFFTPERWLFRARRFEQ
ncbi:hypothetical protein ACFLXC_00725 [Chloroflexota bacterium]